MAKLTREQFVKKYGLLAATLRKHISRGKVVERNGFIDTEAEINKQYIANIYGKIETESGIDDVSDESDNDYQNDSTPKLKSIDKLRAEKLEEEITKLRLANEKSRGELIPVDVVKPLFIQFSKSIMTSFQNEAESILTEISHKHKLNREDQSELRSRFTTIINQAVDEGVKDSKKNIKHLSNEYSESRGRGERKSL